MRNDGAIAYYIAVYLLYFLFVYLGLKIINLTFERKNKLTYMKIRNINLYRTKLQLILCIITVKLPKLCYIRLRPGKNSLWTPHLLIKFIPYNYYFTVAFDEAS